MSQTTPVLTQPEDCMENPAMVRSSGSIRFLPYLGAGILFGFIAIRSEIISWYRIQEMFRFDSFHMYGIIGSAVVVAMISVQFLTRLGVRSADGEAIGLQTKEPGIVRYLVGGSIFGLGWALVGACPGPILALIGAGLPAFGVVLLGALMGTFAYGALRRYLPHA